METGSGVIDKYPSPIMKHEGTAFLGYKIKTTPKLSFWEIKVFQYMLKGAPHPNPPNRNRTYAAPNSQIKGDLLPWKGKYGTGERPQGWQQASKQESKRVRESTREGVSKGWALKKGALVSW